MTLIDSRSMKDLYLSGRYLSVFAPHSRRANSGRFQRAGAGPKCLIFKTFAYPLNLTSNIESTVMNSWIVVAIHMRGSKFNLRVSARAWCTDSVSGNVWQWANDCSTHLNDQRRSSVSIYWEYDDCRKIWQRDNLYSNIYTRNIIACNNRERIIILWIQTLGKNFGTANLHNVFAFYRKYWFSILWSHGQILTYVT